MTQPQHVVSLEVDGFKKIRAVRIEPKTGDPLVQISGRNAQGKSSVLDAITAALCGKGAIPEEPIRKGSKKARIRCDLGELVITRTITLKGGSLKVERADGESINSPQTLLDSLAGELTVDPVAFLRAKPEQQAETLRSVAGISTEDLDGKRQDAYEERTLANRELKSAQARFSAAPHHPDAPAEEVTISELAEQLRTAEEAGYAATRKRSELERATEKRADRRKHIAALEEQLARAREEVAELDEQIEDLEDEVAELEEKAPDPAPLRARMQDAEAANRKARENAARVKLGKELDAARRRSQELTRIIEECDAEKAQRIQAGDYPVEGLEVDDGQVLFQGVPLSQASSAEQLRVAVAVALAQQPTIRVLLVRDGSLLDPDSLAQLAELAREHEAQVWVERVGSAEGAIVIEDGEVEGAAPPEPPKPAPRKRKKKTKKAQQTLELERSSDPFYVVVDLETQCLAQDVGGWKHKAKLPISVAVAYDSRTGEYREFHEKDLGDLVQLLLEAHLVSGFNIEGFDLPVLQKYAPEGTPDLLEVVRTFDVLSSFRDHYGRVAKLQDIAEETLGVGKSGDGLQAVELWERGRLVELMAYCVQDVRVEHALYLHAAQGLPLRYAGDEVVLKSVPEPPGGYPLTLPLAEAEVPTHERRSS